MFIYLDAFSIFAETLHSHMQAIAVCGSSISFYSILITRPRFNGFSKKRSNNSDELIVYIIYDICTRLFAYTSKCHSIADIFYDFIALKIY